MSIPFAVLVGLCVALVVAVAWMAITCRSYKRRAAASDRLAALKAHHANGVSHDVRSFLNTAALNMRVAMGEMRRGNPSDAEHAYADAIRYIRDAGLLADDFLEIGRIDFQQEQTNDVRFPMQDLIEEVTSSFRTPPGVALAVSADQGHVTCDQMKVRRIVRNLVGNAIRHTSDGEVKVMFSLSCGMLTIKVQDTGSGIPADKMSMLFQDFSRLTSVGQGYGLGLAIVKRLASHMGGWVNGESTEGVGSTFTVTVPDRSPTAIPHIGLVGMGDKPIDKAVAIPKGMRALVG